MKQLDKNLYRVQVDLPGSPLGSVNSYILLGEDRNLMVDTGFNLDDCQELMEGALDELGIDRNRLDIFVTHLHADHSGLAHKLAGEGSRIYLNDYGITVLTSDDWDIAQEFARNNGFPSEQLEELFSNHPGKQFSGKAGPGFISLEDGHVLEIGSRRLRVIDTPGHTLGHQSLYDEKYGLFFSGDHVLNDITPNISVYSEHNRYLLVHYLESLDKVADLSVNKVFPGHREPFNDLQKRIGELKKHHELRAVEVKELLDGVSLSAYEVASEMSWDIPLESWEEFPVIQRWFATGEALAHLWALETENEVEVIETEKGTKFVDG